MDIQKGNIDRRSRTEKIDGGKEISLKYI